MILKGSIDIKNTFVMVRCNMYIMVGFLIFIFKMNNIMVMMLRGRFITKIFV